MLDLDPRLVALYDEDNPDGADSDFYRALCESTGARSVIDLGCGTGALTVSFAAAGLTAVGGDPSATMINYARQRPGGDRVTWVLGDSRTLPLIDADYAVMTGNVAEHAPDGDWQRTLADLDHTLRAGGTLAFESRNPAAGAWHEWSSSERSIRDTASGPLEEWSEAKETTPGVVRLVAHNAFVGTGELLKYTEDLFFRELSELEDQLDVAGFDLASVYGDWQRGSVTDSSEVMVLVATAR